MEKHFIDNSLQILLKKTFSLKVFQIEIYIYIYIYITKGMELLYNQIIKTNSHFRVLYVIHNTFTYNIVINNCYMQYPIISDIGFYFNCLWQKHNSSIENSTFGTLEKQILIEPIFSQ